jgi:hypothetical protein
LLFDGLDFGLQILEVLFQPSQALLARVEAAVEMSARLAFAAAAVSMLMMVFPLAATVVAVASSAIAIMTVPAVASAVIIAMSAFIALAAMMAPVMVSMPFIAAHRYFLLFFEGDDD